MKIKVDETNLAAAHVMPLFEAAQKIADMTGDVVLIETFYGIMFEPAPKDEIDAPVMPNIEPHQWPKLDEEEYAQYVATTPVVPCTITTSSLLKDQVDVKN